jgi:hypothetical protein
MIKDQLLQSLSKRRAFFRFLGAFALFNVGINSSRANSDFYLPGHLINFFLKNHFPIYKDWVFVKLELSNPELGFIPKEQRLSLNTAMKVTLVDKKTFTGHAHCSSGFTYDDIKQSIKLKSPTIDQMNIDGLNEKETALLQQINSWVAKLLDGLTVYEFKPAEKSFLNKAPKKIIVEDSGIRLFF